MDKRERNPNFTDEEISLLLDLVEDFKIVVECKKSDTNSRSDKDKAWKVIEERFNVSSSNIAYRDRKVLKYSYKYENLKRVTKKKVVEDKKYVGGTGGGASKDPDYSNVDERVRDLLGSERVEGLSSAFYSDAPIIVAVSGQYAIPVI